MTGLERKKERENDTANVMMKRVVVFRVEGGGMDRN